MTSQPATVVLRIGAKVIWDGALCEIVEFAGGSVVLRSAKGAHFRIRFAELLIPAVEGGRARLAMSESSAAASPVVVWQELSGAELEKVRTRADHIRELLTGYRSGSPAFPRAGEPQPQYAPDASMTSRVQAKARELGVGERTIWDWKKRYEDDDEIGLARRTPLPGASGAREIDPRGSTWLERFFASSTTGPAYRRTFSCNGSRQDSSVSTVPVLCGSRSTLRVRLRKESQPRSLRDTVCITHCVVG